LKATIISGKGVERSMVIRKQDDDIGASCVFPGSRGRGRAQKPAPGNRKIRRFHGPGIMRNVPLIGNRDHRRDQLVKDDFICEPRGTVDVKGKGEMEVWFVTGKRNALAEECS
jgi:hypothetical protein